MDARSRRPAAEGDTVRRARLVTPAAGGLLLAAATAARAHGEEEILFFVWLAEEPHLLRIAAGFLGAAILAFGLFAAAQARRELARAPAAARPPAGRMLAPGAVIAAIGAAVLLAAWLVLPERIPVRHDHPAGARAPGRGR